MSKTGITTHPPTTPPHRESVKETIESVVVAFILAFVFRAFVIEAFVIPTGSMAATLNGEHWSHTCSDCGYAFAVGANRDPRGGLTNQPEVRCPNCDWSEDSFDIKSRTESGDRILVFKWPLDFSRLAPRALNPHRWDVTVFKDPADGTTNFIKRLIGLPGEALQLIDGDVYTAPIDELPESVRQKLVAALEIKQGLRRAVPGSAEATSAVEKYQQLAGAAAEELAPFLRIRQKTRQAQDAFWTVVYDADHKSRRSDGRNQRLQAPAWVAAEDASPWLEDGTVWRFDGLESARREIHLDYKRPEDQYGYNSAIRGPDSPHAPVSDLRLSCVVGAEGRSDDSYCELILSKYENEFRARLQPDGLVSILRAVVGSSDAPEVLCSTETSRLDDGRGRRFSMSNVDYRVTVELDGKVVLSTNDEQYSPDVTALMRQYDGSERVRRSAPRIGMAAAGLDLTVRHIRVERDVYYRNARLREGSDNNVWHNTAGWATTGNPILLRPGEYFFLGDNSPQSKDSRLWWQIGPHLQDREEFQLGTVPEDQIIGRAFFVYWPSGYRAWWSMGRRVIPNVGRMRWIQ